MCPFHIADFDIRHAQVHRVLEGRSSGLLVLPPDPRVLTLRDYHADNLMIIDRPGLRGLGLLDYQDALAGLPASDLASLLQDIRRTVSPELAAAMSGEPGNPDAERWQAEIDHSRAQLEELAAMYGRREIGLTEWQAARTPIERRVTEARKQLGRLTRTTALAGQIGNSTELRERWSSLPLTRQHAIVGAVLDHIVVAPARRGYNRFDPGRFTPVWRA